MSAAAKERPFSPLAAGLWETRAGAAAALSMWLSPAGHVGGGPGASRAPLRVTNEAETVAPRVLVVEPDPSARSLLQLSLSRSGFDVVCVSSAAEAMRQLGPTHPLPALVLAEAEMTGGDDGFALCSQLRANNRTSHLPCILMSRRLESFQVELATGVGADEFLAKPLFVRDVAVHARLRIAPRTVQGGYELETSALPLTTLVRALLAGNRSGRVELADRKGHLAFRQGRLVDAAMGTVRGSEAVTRLLTQAEGAYTVTFGPSLGRASFELTLPELLASVLPAVDRWREVVTRSVPLLAQLVVSFKRLGDVLDELPDGVNELVRLFDGRRTVRDVVADSTLDEVISLEAITRLYSMGVLRPIEEEDLAPVAAVPDFAADRAATAQMEELFATPVREPEAAPVALTRGLEALEAELDRQIEAFQIRPVVERARSPQAAARPFGRQGADDGVARSMQEAASRAADPIPLTRPLSSESSTTLGRIEIVRRPVVPPAPRAHVADPTLVAQRQGAPAPSVATFVPARAAFAAPAAAHLHYLPVSGVAADEVTDKLEAQFFEQEEAEEPTPLTPVPAERVAPIKVLVGLTLTALVAVAGYATAALTYTADHPRSEALPAAPVAKASVVAPPAAPVVTASAMQELLQRGIAAYDSGRAKEAAELVSQYVAQDPNSTMAWLYLGLSRFDSGDRAGAEEAAIQAHQVDPRNGRALMLLASVYLDRGEMEKARAELERYLELEPNGTFAREAEALLRERIR